jgi:hypothetical protein
MAVANPEDLEFPISQRLTFEDLISGIPDEHIVDAGRNGDNLDFVLLRHVEFAVKGPWHGWVVKFTDGTFHEFSREWSIENFAWNFLDKEVLMGFWYDGDE